MGAACSTGFTAGVRSGTLWQVYAIREDGLGVTMHHSERRAEIDDWEDQVFDLRTSYEVDSVWSLGSDRALVTGAAKGLTLLEVWYFDWPDGAYVASVGPRGVKTLEVDGETYLPLASRVSRPLHRRVAVYRGVEQGELLHAFCNCTDPGELFVIHRREGQTLLSEVRIASGEWTTVLSSETDAWMADIDSCGGGFQMKGGEVGYELYNAWGQFKIATTAFALDTDLDGDIDVVEPFHDLEPVSRSPYKDPGAVLGGFVAFRESGTSGRSRTPATRIGEEWLRR